MLVSVDEARANGFRETLTRYATERTRAIYFNTPMNPSGVVFTRSETEHAAQFAIDRDLIVIADEAYEDIVYEGEHVSIASLNGMFERTITSFTFSKSYAMTGWRIGYAVATDPWMTGLRKTTLYSSNGVSTPTQWAALAAFTTESDFLATSRAISRVSWIVRPCATRPCTTSLVARYPPSGSFSMASQEVFRRRELAPGAGADAVAGRGPTPWGSSAIANRRGRRLCTAPHPPGRFPWAMTG